MKEKLAYILAHPLVERDYVRYGMKYMQHTGVLSCVIDAFDLFYKNKDREKLVNETSKILDIFYAKEINDITRNIKDAKINRVIIIAPHNAVTFYKIVEKINKLDIPIATILTGSVPGVNNPLDSFFYRLYNTIKENSLIEFKKKIIRKILLKWYKANSNAFVDYLFYGGEEIRGRLASQSLFLMSKNILSIHSLDYDLYLQKHFEIVNGKYIVFIDQFLPHHPDRHLNSDNMVEVDDYAVDKYYSTINSFFTEIENHYGFKVVVAAHPRSNYVDMDERFNGREVIHGSISELIKFSELCITFHSTALNLVVLHKKPVILIHMEIFREFCSPYGIESATTMSMELKSNFWKIDQYFDINKEVVVDKEAYKKYKVNYIKEEESKDGLFWSVVMKNFVQNVSFSSDIIQ